MSPDEHQLYSQSACRLGSGSDTAYAHSFHIDGTKLLDAAGEGTTVISGDICKGESRQDGTRPVTRCQPHCLVALCVGYLILELQRRVERKP
jgi:hypothetical protein